MTFKNLSIVQKLLVGFGAVLAIVAISSGLIFKQTLDLSETERLSASSTTIVDLVDQIVADAASVRAAAYKVIISGDNADFAPYLAAKAEYRKDVTDAQNILKQDAPQDLTSFAAAIAVVDVYLDRFVENQAKLSLDPATHQQSVDSVLSSPSVSARKAYQASITALRDQVAKSADALTARSVSTMSSSIWTVAVAGLLEVLMGAVMAWFIAKSIGGPIRAITDTMRTLAAGDTGVEVPARDQTNEIGQMAAAVQTFKEAAIEKVRLEAAADANRRSAQTERERAEAIRATAVQQQAQVVGSIADGLNKLAAGDLLQQIDQPFAPDYEGLRGDFNAAVVQLKTTIKEVLASTSTIRNGTGEIASASDDLSRRTEQQAANLEETAAALAEISTAMKRTAEGASHARQVVGTTQQTAEQSNHVISQTITAMDSIDEASRKISQIIGVIDEIAFQTNLLALNAGVEAARAGEAGRGFAVVASEVRALAQRCAEAAKEVKILVRSSEEHVKSGVDLVGESGSMLAMIVTQVAELKTIVEDIARSAESQASGLSEVNVAVNQLDQVTQQNAAMAEEATAAARQLAQEGSELVRLVGQFNVGATHVMETRQVPAARAAKPAPRPQMKKVANGGFVEAARNDADGWQEF